MRTSSDDGAATADPGLFASFGDLARAGAELVQNTAELAACESRLLVRKLAVRAGLFFAFLVLATSGVLLTLGGVAVLLGDSGAMPLWLALVLVGLATAAAGALFAKHMVHKLGDRDLAFPGTLGELKSDVEMFTRRHRR